MKSPVEPSQVLLAHNQWANGLLIEACRGLSDDQLDHEFEMGLGTLRKTITHIFGAMRGWTDVLSKQTPRERLESDAAIGVAEWTELQGSASAELLEAAFAGPMDEVLSAERAGKTYSFVRGHVITHITTHGMHHRAQCLNMLRHLGVSDIPKSSVMEWGFEVVG